MFSEHWSRKIEMNYFRLQQVISKFPDWWLCWLWARMILGFSIVADLWCGWWWFSWSLLTLLTFGADDDGGRLLLLVFSAHAANFTTSLFLIMPGGHKLLMVGHLVNHRGIPVILVMSVILWHEKTKIQKIIGCGNFDVFSVKTIIHNNIKKMGHLFYLWGFSYMRFLENEMSQDDTRLVGLLLWLAKHAFFCHIGTISTQ